MDERSNNRVATDTIAECAIEDRYVDAKVWDLSVSGCKLQVLDKDLKVGDDCTIRFDMGVLAKGTFLYEVVLTDEAVKFGFDKYTLSDEAKAELDKFANKLKSDNQGVYLEIQGHTDNIGSEKYNLKLGYQRAEQVMEYLKMEHGFPLHRMNVTSYGEYKPIADNSTKEGRAQNRRVALVVLQ